MNETDTLRFFLNFALSSGQGILNYFADLPGAISKSNPENEWQQFVYIPGTREDKVLLLAHTDTVWDNRGEKEILPLLIENNGIFSSGSPFYGIGADDRSGCAILWLLRNSGHSLLLLNGEEQGLVGAHYLKDNYPEIFQQIQDDHCFAIEFDRQNSTDFKTYRVGSAQFNYYVEEMTGYNNAGTGSYTDICVVCRDICGVNLSTGYNFAHSKHEQIVIKDWLNTLELARKWLSMPKLQRFLQKPVTGNILI